METVLLGPADQVELAAVIAELSQVLERSLKGEKVVLRIPIVPVARLCMPALETRKP